MPNRLQSSSDTVDSSGMRTTPGVGVSHGQDGMNGPSESSGPRRFPCPGCGASLEFNPVGGVLACQYCGRTEVIPASAEHVVERSYMDYLRPGPDRLAALTAAAMQAGCGNCGASVTFEPPDVAGLCPFCGTAIVAQPQSADPLVTPSGLIPFRTTRQDAASSIHQWLATRWFAPNALKRQAHQDQINGVYLPFWTYDSNTVSHYRGERGEHYYETEYYTETDSNGKSVTKSRQVQKTRWYSASGTVERWFDDVLIAATTSVDSGRLGTLEPWDLPALQSYDPRFLAGYKAQRYTIDVDQGFETAKGVMAPTIRTDVRRDIGGDEQRIHSVSTSYSGITFKHLLLPVWITAYQYGGKVYQVMVNACTGEVQGDRPYSFWKIATLVAAIAALLVYLYVNYWPQQ
jgi:hypothetical protein